MSELITGELSEIIEYDLIDSELKQKLIKDPKLAKDIDKWTKKYIHNRHAFGIKECNVEYIDYDSIDLDELDEVEAKDLMSKIRKNERLCPNHRTCLLYKNNAIVKGSKCVLEIADATLLKEALCTELEVGANDFNDIISIDQLVSINILGNRALRALSSEALIDTTVTYGKNGGVQYDKKINDNFAVFEKTQALSDRVKKALVLNRDDKIKLKRLVEGKTKEDAKLSIKNKLNNMESSFDIGEIVDVVQNEQQGNNYTDDAVSLIKKKIKEEKKKTNEKNDLEIGDING